MARVVFFLIGCLLAFSATAKLWAIVTNPFADLHYGIPLFAIWFLISIETCVVVILVSECSVRLKWLVAVWLFAAFLLQSVSNSLLGSKACGCFGDVVNLHPIIMCLLNLCVLCSLAVIRKFYSRNFGARILEAKDLAVVGQVAALLVFGSLFSLSSTGFSQQLINKHLYGHKVSVALQGAQRQAFKTGGVCVRLKISNAGANCKIVGIGKSCGCVVLDGENLVGKAVPSTGHIFTELKLLPKRPGLFHQRVHFFLDSPTQYVAVADIQCLIEEF